MAQSKGKVITHDLYRGEQFAGYTRLDSLQVEIDGSYVEVNIDQFNALAGLFSMGTKGRIVGAFIDASNRNLAAKFGEFTPEIVGPNNEFVAHLGTQQIDKFEEATRSLMHPHGRLLTDKSEDMMFWSTVLRLNATKLLSSRTKAQEVEFVIECLADENRPAYAQVASFGNWADSLSTPLAVILRFNEDLVQPYTTDMALTLWRDGRERILGAFSVYGTLTAITALVNGAVTTAANTITFDTLSSVNAIIAGMMVKIGTELSYVKSVVYGGGGTSGTLTVARANLKPSTLAAHADNAPITVYSDIFVLNVLQSTNTIWNSTDPTAVTIGDVVGGFDDTRPGVLVNVNAGGVDLDSDITAEYNTVVSDPLTVTAIAAA